MHPLITESILRQTLSFDDYLKLAEDIVEEKIPRAGMYASDNTFRYTRSNLERMKKVLSEIVVNQKLYNLLSGLNEEWLWLVISEAWCGDASWSVPVLYILAACSEKILFRILLRDSFPEIIKAYQTERTDSIPKLICFRKKDMRELGTWGPRPQMLQQQILERKKMPNFDYRESVRAIHAWYETDNSKSIQEEMIDCVKEWKAATQLMANG